MGDDLLLVGSAAGGLQAVLHCLPLVGGELLDHRLMSSVGLLEALVHQFLASTALCCRPLLHNPLGIPPGFGPLLDRVEVDELAAPAGSLVKVAGLELQPTKPAELEGAPTCDMVAP